MRKAVQEKRRLTAILKLVLHSVDALSWDQTTEASFRSMRNQHTRRENTQSSARVYEIKFFRGKVMHSHSIELSFSYLV